MRAQLRTYHSIPSLQAYQDSNAYKQLQDAPRLKSILKGASEDIDQPNTLEKIKASPHPRTNPVNLIFVMANYAPQISEAHFFPPRDFFDLIMRSTLSSKSRARAFLWLMWWYLESDFSREAALNNPFGPGLDGEGTGGLPIKVPEFESLTEDQANEENVDTPEEMEYGETKRLERKRRHHSPVWLYTLLNLTGILEEDDPPLPRVPKRPKKGVCTRVTAALCSPAGLPEYGYDDDQTSDLVAARSTMSTPLHPSVRRYPEDEEEDPALGQSTQSRAKRPKREPSLNRSAAYQRVAQRTKAEDPSETGSPGPANNQPSFLNRFVPEPSLAQQHPSRRPRPLTQHQLAVEQYRRQRIEYLLAQRRNEAHQLFRAKRQCEIPFIRYSRLTNNLPDGYDTDDEQTSFGKGGLCPNPEEEEDFGEGANYFLSVIRKAARRLDRWDYENANGPKRDRQKEREERQKAKLEKLALDESLEATGGGRTSTSNRNRNRNARSRRKTGNTAAASRAGNAASAGHAQNDRRAGGRSGGSAVANTKARAAPHKDSEDGLDDIDRELLGEASEEDGAAAASSRPQGYADSYMGGGSSDESDEELDEGGEVDGRAAGEGYDNLSNYEGADSSSIAGGDPDGGESGRRPSEQRPRLGQDGDHIMAGQ